MPGMLGIPGMSGIPGIKESKLASPLFFFVSTSTLDDLEGNLGDLVGRLSVFGGGVGNPGMPGIRGGIPGMPGVRGGIPGMPGIRGGVLGGEMPGMPGIGGSGIPGIPGIPGIKESELTPSLYFFEATSTAKT